MKPITIAGEKITPTALTLKEIIELALIFVPYCQARDREKYELIAKTAKPLCMFLLALIDEIEPADLTRILAILLHKEPEWFQDKEAIELVAALPALDAGRDNSALVESLYLLALRLTANREKKRTLYDG